jgi:hypothetical protein
MAQPAGGVDRYSYASSLRGVLESTYEDVGRMTRLVERWMASPLGKSRLIAFGITMICLMAMIAIAYSESIGVLSGIF